MNIRENVTWAIITIPILFFALFTGPFPGNMGREGGLYLKRG
jgi:hypothetical protein